MTCGMQLPGVPDDHAVGRRDLGAPARMPGRLLRRPADQGDTQGLGREVGHGQRLLPAGRHGRALPARGAPGPGQHRGEVPRLIAERRVHGGELGVGRSAGHRRARRGRGRFGGVEHRTRLHDGQVVVAATAVARDRREQTGQQRGPQVGSGLGERVGDPVEPASPVTGRHPELVQLFDGGEREAQHLDEAGGHHRGGHRPTTSLDCRQAAADRRPRHGGGDGVVTDQPTDLLDVVVRVGQVGSPARRGDRQRRAVDGHRGADRLQQRHHGAGIDGGAEDAARQVGLDRGDGGSGHRSDDGLARRRGSRRRARPAGRPPDERPRTPPPDPPHARSDDWPPSSACAGGTSARRSSRRSARPPPPRTVVSAPISVLAPPITPARPMGPVPSVINRSSVLQVADHVVEGGQLLPRVRATDHDRPVQPVRVVRVDRLPGLQHHVVGDVDGQRDRAHPGQLHPAGQPARARPGRVDAGHRDGDEERAGVGLRAHRVAVGHGGRRGAAPPDRGTPPRWPGPPRAPDRASDRQ